MGAMDSWVQSIIGVTLAVSLVLLNLREWQCNAFVGTEQQMEWCVWLKHTLRMRFKSANLSLCSGRLVHGWWQGASEKRLPHCLLGTCKSSEK